MENALIILVRNSEKGRVKTRLSKDIGDDLTLDVYKHLLHHTRNIAVDSNCSRFVFYSSYVHVNDMFDDDLFTKLIQEGNDLGERMMNAFKKVFDLGCKRACIIGSDCYELNPEIIDKAFENLKLSDLVIGPATDGGYYLIGMKELHPELFLNKEWGTSTVFDDTVDSITTLGLDFTELEVLNDIDTITDLVNTDILSKLKENR